MAFPPNAGSVSIQSFTASGDTEVLARRRDDDAVDGFEVVASDVGDIFIELGVGEPCTQNLPAFGVDLDRPFLFEAGPFESERHAAYAGTERSTGECHVRSLGAGCDHSGPSV